MCGIVGFNWQDEKLAKISADLLNHRGPDQSGVYTDALVSLSHRRLSIIDLSVKGNQPMSNEDQNIYLVFNGEIFNHKSLRRELQDKGHTFSSRSDSEVLVHLYEEYRTSMLDKLEGQFSFCIYDRIKMSLFLARDRVGILPLYYCDKGEKFIFGSELKVVLKCMGNSEIDSDSVAEYLRFGYISAPSSIIKDVLKVEAGHFLEYSLVSKSIIKNKRYWPMPVFTEIKGKNEMAGELKSCLKEAVLNRLEADVGIGAFLSGGVDSSIICFLIKKFKKGLKTFSIKFDSFNYDESKYSRLMSKVLGTEHTEILCSKAEVQKAIEILTEHFDEPFADSSAIATYLVSKIARSQVTICLSGDGADELLGGYNRYRYMKVALILNRLPRLIKRSIRFFLSFFITLRPSFGLERVRDLLANSKLSELEVFEILSEKIDRGDLAKLLQTDFKLRERIGFLKNKKGLSAYLSYDLKYYLEGDILTKVDRAAMANSLEVRPPFLDHRLIELCLSIPDSYKIKGKESKWLLKQAFKNDIPRAILKRKKKGFSVPIKSYLKNEFKDLVDKYVLKYDKHNLFNSEFIGRMHNGISRKDKARLFWAIMVFNLWHERWFLNEKMKNEKEKI